jgi:hypothetical protein
VKEAKQMFGLKFLAPILTLLLLAACTSEVEEPVYGDPLPELVPPAPQAFEPYLADAAIALAPEDASAICRAAVGLELGVSPSEGRVSFNNANFVDVTFAGQTRNCVVGSNGIGRHHPQLTNGMHGDITDVRMFAYKLTSDRVVIIRKTDRGMISSTILKSALLRSP